MMVAEGFFGVLQYCKSLVGSKVIVRDENCAVAAVCRRGLGSAVSVFVCVCMCLCVDGIPWMRKDSEVLSSVARQDLRSILALGLIGPPVNVFGRSGV